jgi:hypothetical protein
MPWGTSCGGRCGCTIACSGTWRNIEDQVNDPMEEDDDANNIVEEDGTNILIQETFNNDGMDDDDDQLDGVFDIPILEKASQPLYEGSKISLLSAILLLVNLKVMNGLSNTCVTQLLRYVIYFVTLSK